MKIEGACHPVIFVCPFKQKDNTEWVIIEGEKLKPDMDQIRKTWY